MGSRKGCLNNKSLPERLEEKIARIPECGCWIWMGAHNERGYGLITINHKAKKAHRVLWALHGGVIPHGMCVCHRCDTPACVNPHHLFLGTLLDNNRDRDNKGRSRGGQVKQNGEENGRAKLSTEDVLKIRGDKRIGTVIAREYGVHKNSIYNIKNGVCWAHILTLPDGSRLRARGRMMGDAADDLIEQGMDNSLAHQLGQCDNYCQYCEEEYQKDLRNNREVKAFEKKFIESQQELDPECKKILNEHFWELVDDDNTTHNTRKEKP